MDGGGEGGRHDIKGWENLAEASCTVPLNCIAYTISKKNPFSFRAAAALRSAHYLAVAALIMPAVGESKLDARPGAAVFGVVSSGKQACLGTPAGTVACCELGCVQCALIWKPVGLSVQYDVF